jgi:hypothetical protein
MMCASFAYGQLKTKRYDEKSNLIQWPDSFHPQDANFYIYNEIEIDAPPEVVWNIIIDAKNWHTYYTGVQMPVVFIDSVKTVLDKDVSFRLKTMDLELTPVMQEFIPKERMAWEVNTPKLKAYHAWLIIPTDNGCKLITPETQNGMLTYMQKIFLPNKLINLHEEWLLRIKSRAEKTEPIISNAERISIIANLNQNLSQFDASIHNLSESQLNYKPSPDEWSISECIEHIALAEQEFPKIISTEIQKPADPKQRKKIKIQDDEIRPKMISNNWKAKSPEVFKPNFRFSSAEQAAQEFRRQRMQNIEYIETTSDDLRNHYWKHRLTGRIDLYQTLILLSAHAERHINQIHRIKRSSSFPNQ